MPSKSEYHIAGRQFRVEKVPDGWVGWWLDDPSQRVTHRLKTAVLRQVGYSACQGIQFVLEPEPAGLPPIVAPGRKTMADAYVQFRLKVASGHWPTIREGKPLGKFVIFARDQFRCLYCDKYLEQSRDAHIDHVVPVSGGGKCIAGNVAVACVRCNCEKHNKRHPQEVEYLATIAKRNEARGIRGDWPMNPMDFPPRVSSSLPSAPR